MKPWAGWTQDVTVTPSTGSYVGGVWVDVSGTPYTLNAFIRPASMKDIQLLDVGLRETEAITIISETGLTPLIEHGTPQRGDVVTYQSRTYRVRLSGKVGDESFPDIGPIVHWRAVAVLEA